jgi:hypothetical protein
VVTSWTNVRKLFKSPLRVVAAVLFRSREAKAEKCRASKRELDNVKMLLVQCDVEIERQQDEIRQLKEQVRRQDVELQRQAQASCSLPPDPPLKGHRYGCRLIALAVNLARLVGLRASESVLKMVWQWLGVQQKIPHWTTIRGWLLRDGVAALKQPHETADDWVWLADHSNQIGQEKALAVLGVRASKLPPPGTALKHEDVRLLTIQPGMHWKRDDMASIYRLLADRYGTPRAVLCDGAVELREGAQSLQTRSPDMVVLQDFKHKAAIFLKGIVGAHPRFLEFHAHLGKTRSAVQQTELAHLTPPSPKPKARFMNLAASLTWATTVLWLLEHPEAKACALFSPQRLEEKLGWLRSFGAELAEWQACQAVVNAGLKFINEQGLYCGAGKAIRQAMGVSSPGAASGRLAERIVAFVTEAEGRLKEGERLPMSTEILESTFSLYKQLERQHSKGGFTSLLASFGSLLRTATAETIRHAFSTTSVQDVRDWTRQNLCVTVTAKRQAAYKEARSATKLAVAT